VFTSAGPERPSAYPDTLVGTDSHAPLINGLGVLGWRAGRIEAEASMLGQPMSALTPQVVGLKLTADLTAGTTSTGFVLTVSELWRRAGVVGKFVDFFGPGVSKVPLATGAALFNMSPEYGSTVSIFPIDDETLRYLRLTGQPPEQVAPVEAYAKEQGLWHDPDHELELRQVVELNLATVEPAIAGPKRPQDRIPLRAAQRAVRGLLAGQSRADAVQGGRDDASADSFLASEPIAISPRLGRDVPLRSSTCEQQLAWPSDPTRIVLDGTASDIDHGTIVIAAITTCSNTSNPSVMIAAGLLAKKAVQRGLSSKPWVKTALAPGSRLVTDYFDRAGLTPSWTGSAPAGRLRLHDVRRELRTADRPGQRGGV